MGHNVAKFLIIGIGITIASISSLVSINVFAFEECSGGSPFVPCTKNGQNLDTYVDYGAGVFFFDSLLYDATVGEYNPDIDYVNINSFNHGSVNIAWDSQFGYTQERNILISSIVSWVGVAPTPYQTRFISFDISTTTSMVNITGYWNATTTPNITEQLDFYQYSTMLGKESYLSITATSTGYFDVNLPYKPLPTPYTGATTTTTITADLYFYANLYEINSSYYNPFGEYDTRYSTLLDATSTILTASTTNLWNIDTNDLFLYPEYLCDITSLTGCFKNALIWAFYPTKKAVENFYDLQTLVQSKAPFGYFSVVKTNIEGLSATSTPSFTLVIPASLKTYIFNPFDIGLSSILWLFFVFNFYKRLKHLQI